MKYTLPTQHVLYFGLQAKRDKLDAAGNSKDGNRNVAEIHHHRGITRKPLTVSTGSWVGPSSPTPIESCVKM